MITIRKSLIVTSLTVAVMLGAGPVGADWSAGVDLYKHGRFSDAAGHFRQVVETNPAWPGGYLMLGRCELAMGQPSEALDHLRVAVVLGPGDPANAATLSRALIAADLQTEALELLENLDFENLSPPWKAEFARMLARCLIAEDRATEAVTVLETRLDKDPDNAALHRAIATAYKATGDRMAVLDHLARAFFLDPDDHASGHAATTAALVLAAAAGDEDLAANLYDRALELAAKLATVAPDYDNDLLAGEAAFAASQLEVAASWFATAVKRRQQEPMARYRLGSTLSALGRNDEAIANLRTALGAAPDDELSARVHDRLGRLLACRLELPEAARHYRAAGDDEHATRVDELAASFNEALARLAGLRSDVAEMAGMEAELEVLGDADGVIAVADRREAMGRNIAAIEDNLSEVRTALCQ